MTIQAPINEIVCDQTGTAQNQLMNRMMANLRNQQVSGPVMQQKINELTQAYERKCHHNQPVHHVQAQPVHHVQAQPVHHVQAQPVHHVQAQPEYHTHAQAPPAESNVPENIEPSDTSEPICKEKLNVLMEKLIKESHGMSDEELTAKKEEFKLDYKNKCYHTKLPLPVEYFIHFILLLTFIYPLLLFAVCMLSIKKYNDSDKTSMSRTDYEYTIFVSVCSAILILLHIIGIVCFNSFKKHRLRTFLMITAIPTVLIGWFFGIALCFRANTGETNTVELTKVLSFIQIFVYLVAAGLIVLIRSITKGFKT
jgi:uncharacterized membrane protein YhaH (DUF805 family)